MSAERLRKDAVLVYRCTDCNGRVIAHVNYRGGKPALWTHGPRPATSSWTELDGRPRTVAAWCLWGKFWIDCAELLPNVPAPGERVTHTVDHTRGGRANRKDAGTFRTVAENSKRYGVR